MKEQTQNRLLMVQSRAKELRLKREQRQISILSLICFCCTVGLVGTIVGYMGGTATVYGVSGAILMYEEAGGYVLVALLAFGIGAIVSVLLVQNRGKKK